MGAAMNSYLKAMSKYGTFQGRSSRSEYWLFTLFAFLIGVAASIVDLILEGHGSGLLSALASLVHFIPSLAVGVRRLHDINRTGWWLLAPCGGVAIVGATVIAAISSGTQVGPVFALALILLLALVVTLFVFCCLRATPGPTRFGPEPIEPARPGQGGSPGGWGGTPYPGSPPGFTSPGPSPAPYASRDTIEEVERLSRLRADGSLSEIEFATLKAQALGTTGGSDTGSR